MAFNFDVSSRRARSGFAWVPRRSARGSMPYRLARAVVRTALVLVLAAVALLAAGFPGFLREIEAINAARGPARSDGIVVLTGGADRIAGGALLLREGAGRRLLISGVNERATGDQVVRHAPALRDVAGCCVDFGYAARDTIGNAREARDWTARNGFGSLTLVTSHYHMPRALAEFAHALPGTALTAFAVVPDGVEFGAWWRDAHVARLLAVEYLKYVVASARIRAENASGAPLGDAAAALLRSALSR